MNKQYIFTLYSRKSLKTMSGSKKKLYKLLLTALSANLFMGNILNLDSLEIINNLETLLKETYNTEEYNSLYKQYKEFLANQFSNDKVFKSVDENYYNELIIFTREVLGDLIDKNVSVYTREEVEKHINIGEAIKVSGNTMWIGVSFEKGIYPFVPEKLVWYDFKVIWNMYAKYKKLDLDNWVNSVEQGMQYKRITDNKSLEIQYIAGTMERSVLVSCVTFIESFLYNTRIIIRDNSIFNKKIKDNNLSKIIKNDKINDTQIIEDILFKIYPSLKESIKENYKVYKKLLKLRDKYIHISVRENEYKQPEMNSLLCSSGLNIEMKIEYALDIVDKINSVVLDTEGIDLLWWKKHEPCDFENFGLFNIV